MAKPIAWALDYEVFEQLFKESVGIEEAPEVTTIVTDDVSCVACIILRVSDETYEEIAKDMVESGDYQLVPDQHSNVTLN